MSFIKCGHHSQSALVNGLVSQGVIKSQNVINAMNAVDRANYSPSTPYVDAPQGTLEGQTISAPHMHGYALELLSDNIMVIIT